jgi:hypothetical protein
VLPCLFNCARCKRDRGGDLGEEFSESPPSDDIRPVIHAQPGVPRLSSGAILRILEAKLPPLGLASNVRFPGNLTPEEPAIRNSGVSWSSRLPLG